MNTYPRESYHVNRIKHRLAYASYLGDFRYRTILLLVRTMGDYRVQLYVLVQGLYDSFLVVLLLLILGLAVELT